MYYQKHNWHLLIEVDSHLLSLFFTCIINFY